MINPNELRIGNLVYCNTAKLVVKVQWPHPAQLVVDIKGPFVRCDYTHGDLEEFDPIPLTAEWLEKFGFKYDNVCEIYELNGIMLCEYHGEGCRLVELDREGEIVHVGKVFAYVHQLQNIYLDLNHEELTIKETV